jgi:hypothetical protein
MNRIRGRVLQVLKAPPYAYVQLGTSKGKEWVAVPATEIKIGSMLAVVDAMPMERFESRSLKRTFDLIYFGNVETNESAKAAAEPPSAPAPDEKIEAATGPTARTVADVYPVMVVDATLVE